MKDKTPTPGPLQSEVPDAGNEGVSDSVSAGAGGKVGDSANSRRRFLFKTVAILPASAALASCAPSQAQTAAEPSSSAPAASAASASTVDLQQYTPQYFNADEWAFIKAAVDRLIPADEEGPGALELNVPVFIDKQMDASFGHASTWYMSAPFKPDAEALWGYQGALPPRDLYRAGIAALNAHCKQTFSGHTFATLDPAQQTQLLEDMDGGKLTLDAVSVRDFFTFLLQNTKEGYLADPMYGGNKDAAAWKMIGFPGARADFLDWVGKDKVYPFPPVTIEGQQNS